MPIVNRIADYADEMRTWRRHLHQNPELSLDCHETAKFVVARLREFGITGIDVYDETALTLTFYGPDRQRRSDEELISLVRTVQNPPMDVMVPYTIYARAVTDPYTSIVKLQMSLNYRALDVRSGRFLGGDNLDIDTAGVPFTGCAAGLAGTQADPHCVKEFVSANGERLARNAGNKLALQIGALLGPSYGGVGNAATGGAQQNAAVDATAPSGGTSVGVSDGCANLPTTYAITFRGFDQRQMNAVEEYMAFWSCAIDLDVSDSDFSEITYVYKTRASEQRMLRNIRLMMELMGQIAEPTTQGSNQIVVEALNLRSN